MAVIVDAGGVRSAATSFDVQEETVAKRFFWLDIFGGGEAERTDFLNQLGLEADDVNWMQRFGQTSRMMLGRRKLRAVNWQISSLIQHADRYHADAEIVSRSIEGNPT